MTYQSEKKIYSGLSYSVFCEKMIEIIHCSYLILYLHYWHQQLDKCNIYLISKWITILSGVAQTYFHEVTTQNSHRLIYQLCRPTSCIYFSQQMINNKTH